MNTMIPIGLQKFSGIESYCRTNQYGVKYDGYFIIINDTVYAFEIDPDDGYRSYGNIYIPENMTVNSIKNKFPSQDVFIMFRSKQPGNNKCFYTINDLITGKTILEIGTDYSDSYYPIAICNYYPENMHINSNRNISDKIETESSLDSGWNITYTNMPNEFITNKNIEYIINIL